MADLEIRDLHVRIEEREILKGVDLDISRGEVHALMGPNGSGKSTLANTLLGHPSYEITEGSITFKGEDITAAEPHERAKAGLFLAFQYPVSIPGVSVANFLRMAINAKRTRSGTGDEPIQVKEFRTQLQHAIELLDVDKAFTSRHLNDGFSGGEKKRAEILQMAMLAPDVAILDETDSGLDIDALRTVAEGVQKLHEEQGLGALIITHYQRILHYIKPQFVHILMDGRIVLQGGVELVERLEREGYDQLDAALKDDPAIHQDVHELGLDVVEDALVVGDDQRTQTLLLVQLLDALGDGPQRVDVETRVGLVEDRHIRCEHRHLEDLRALLLATGEAVVEVAGGEGFVDVQQLDRVLQLGAELLHLDRFVACARTGALGVDRHAQEVRDGDAGDRDGVLEGEEQPGLGALVRFGRGDVLALEGDRPLGDLIRGMPEEGVGERRLARAVRAHQRVDLPA